MILHWFRSKLFVGLACIGLAALWDLLFWGHPLGWSAAIFAGALVGLLVIRAPSLWRFWMGRTAMVVAGAAVLALVEEPSPLALLVAIMAAGSLTLIAQRDIAFEDHVSAWLLRWARLLATLWLRLLFDNVLVSRWIFRHPRAGGRLIAAATFIAWWFLPVMAGLFFLLLFAIANPIIEQWLRQSLDNLWLFLDWLSLLDGLRVLLWIAVVLGTYGLLRHRRSRHARRKAVDMLIPPVQIPAGWRAQTAWLTGQGMIIRCLAVFNTVFLVQTLLDILYLYGGASLPAGMTYAHYAHRGAYPLIFTALIAGFFVLMAFRTGGAGHRSPWARRLVYLWIAQNLFLLVSTVWRLWLYVEAYSLTRLRTATMVWVVLVALGFLWIIARIIAARSNAWLWRMNAFTLFAVLCICAFINFDGLIADFNVRHCREVDGRGAPLDLAYLRELGPDALPALAWLDAQHAISPLLLAGPRDALRTQLASELVDWRGWTYRRWREAPPELRRQTAARW